MPYSGNHGISLTQFWKKIRESNGFNNIISEDLVSRIFFEKLVTNSVISSLFFVKH